MKKGALVSALLFLLIGAPWYWLNVDDHKADPSNASQVALGQAVYGQYCVSCHGATAGGSAKLAHP